ncbi:MAG: hypothetical protein M1828_006648 [Chrysothrix sp. TS-e1954]|nr:MAG: hypothetical protein M1828_006648 [Chrysothrix sp. TS-e1954]
MSVSGLATGQASRRPVGAVDPMLDYLADSPSDFAARMTNLRYSLPSLAQPAMSEANKPSQSEEPSDSLVLSDRTYTNNSASLRPPSVSSASTCPPSEASSARHPPSLTHSGSTKSSGFSVGTSLASAVSGYPFLEPGEDQLRPPRLPRFECSLHFLPCDYASDDVSEWKTHCLWHFHQHEPPKKVSCPLCPFTKSFRSGWEAWETRLNHVALHHSMGYSLASGRPDFELYTYLKNRRLISDAQYRDLTTDGGSSVGGEEEVSTTTHSDRDERRHFRSRR